MDTPLIIKPQYMYDPEQLVHTFCQRILKQWPGYRLIGYKFLGNHIIELSLSR